MNLWESFKKSQKLLFISLGLILFISTVLFFMLKIDVIKPLIDNIITLVGFTATIYSVLLTILLYHFISLSDAEFVINSNIYVERNKQTIIAKTLRLSNFMKDAVNDIHNERSENIGVIPADIRSDFIYIKSLNKKHVNERTTLYQCKETFDQLENLITASKIHEVTDIKKIELEKLNVILVVLIELTIHLDTIFNNKE